MTLECLQEYWWLLVSVLGGLLVFLLFVQGGQSMLLLTPKGIDRNLIVNSIGGKWELTFTTLVVFGGAAFASFPLFYSTSFGGAYWLWILILFSFVLQAVSYEFRRKKGNIYGTSTYDLFLFFNGCFGCILLGVAVAMFFFGAEFTVSRGNLLDVSAPVISNWAPSHGIEAIFNFKNLTLGFAVLFLARTLSSLYMINNVKGDERFSAYMRMSVIINAIFFLVCFLTFLGLLLTATGYEYDPATGVVSERAYKYFYNFMEMPLAAVVFLAGVVLVLIGIALPVFKNGNKNGIWYAGIGTVLTVMALFWISGYNNTAFYPSLADAQSSLTIRNASSSKFTLEVMSYVSVIIPFVVAYIWYVWRKLDMKKLTPESLENSDHQY